MACVTTPPTDYLAEQYRRAMSGQPVDEGEPGRPLTLAEQMAQHAVHADGTIGPDHRPPDRPATRGRRVADSPAEARPALAAPEPAVPPPPPPLTLEQHLDQVGRRIERLTRAAEASADLDGAFGPASRIINALRVRAGGSGLRRRVAGAIRDDRELSLIKLARQLGVIRSRAGQLLTTAVTVQHPDGGHRWGPAQPRKVEHMSEPMTTYGRSAGVAARRRRDRRCGCSGSTRGRPALPVMADGGPHTEGGARAGPSRPDRGLEGWGRGRYALPAPDLGPHRRHLVRPDLHGRRRLQRADPGH